MFTYALILLSTVRCFFLRSMTRKCHDPTLDCDYDVRVNVCCAFTSHACAEGGWIIDWKKAVEIDDNLHMDHR